MALSRSVIVAGAGIGGLTAGLALAHRGFRAVVLDQAPRLEEAGAGIQLSPNATRVLIGLGLEQRLLADAVVPEAIEIRTSGGWLLNRVPLGRYAEKRYGAPYWVTHRADLQAALVDAANASPDVALRLGTRVEDFVVHGNGVTVACRRGPDTADEVGIALIGADGLWSGLRRRLGRYAKPLFHRRVAWRALVPADDLTPAFRASVVRLWLGRGAHLVHYPVKAGKLVNIVAIVNSDHSGEFGWSEPGAREAILARLSGRDWSPAVRELVGRPERWQTWALYDLPPLPRWGDGPATLLGDAAHPTLPFVAQGAAMAIEDAAVLAAAMARAPDDIPDAMRRYERTRRRRTRKVQKAARRNGRIYHTRGVEASLRNLYLRVIGGKLLLRGYDWLYAWRPAPP